MKTMKALRFEKYGPPSVLAIQELPVPDLKTGEALVELHASAINPSDVKNVAGVFKASLPRIPGRDFAGVVVAGDGWKGKEVWGSGAGFGISRDGTCAIYRRRFGRALQEAGASFHGRCVRSRRSLSRRVVGPG
jgi:NADPH2:quinone reductase